ncbi:SIS domain-containing protein [Candidatus Woesearchaeota archaeon]|nr:SIS domain-containing protein [Candidatus Woesearchaeota archaeon]
MENSEETNILEKYIDNVGTILQELKKYNNEVNQASDKIIHALEKGNKVFICGNGGSNCDTQHISAELTGRFLDGRERKGLAAIALPTSLAAVTAIANDYGYEFVFERELQSLSNPGDILIGISTSGNSTNVLNAIKYAKNNNIYVISILGKTGGKIKGLSDIEFVVPSKETGVIQIVHSIIYHAICDKIDEYFVNKNQPKQ